MKQMTFIEEPDSQSKKYSVTAGSPLYIPKDRKPHILELRDTTKTHALMRAIDAASGLTPEEKIFLAAAAHRHTVFNYELIADYYAHATSEMRGHMEKSALVIVDVNFAIENGYVRLCDTIKRLHMQEISQDA